VVTQGIVCTGIACPSGAIAFPGRSEPGFGGRIGYNLNKHFALEGELNFFPQHVDPNPAPKLEGLFGVNGGSRFEKIGVFIKARPGFLRISKGGNTARTSNAICAAISPPPIGCFEPVTTTSFAFDLGGIFEWYPSERTIVRVDAGDTRFGRKTEMLRYAFRHLWLAYRQGPTPATAFNQASGLAGASETRGSNL